MGEGKVPYSLEEEARGQNINVGNEEIECSAYRANIEPIEMMETMKNLRMEVQSCRPDNERMLRAREQQNQLNIQLMHSLNFLYKQMQFGSNSFHDKEDREKSKKRSYERSKHSKSATMSPGHCVSPPHVTRRSYSSKESRSDRFRQHKRIIVEK